jgi:hypothetical protein
MSEPTPAPPAEMKQCQYCGKMTSTKANFCYWCARELVARPERPESSNSSKPIRMQAWAWVALGVVAAAAVIIFLVLR